MLVYANINSDEDDTTDGHPSVADAFDGIAACVPLPADFTVFIIPKTDRTLAEK